MKVISHSHKTLTREKLELEIDENALEIIVRDAIAEQYPDYIISKFEVSCGMGQGQGFFQSIDIELTSEVEDAKCLVSPTRNKRR